MNKNNDNNINNNYMYKVHKKCYKCYYNGHISANCPFRDNRYQFELTKMYITDLTSSQWTPLEVNQYYLQKVFRDFPTVEAIREYLSGRGAGKKFRGQIIKSKADKVSESRDGSLGEVFRIFAKMIDKETAEQNKKLEEELKLKKKCPTLENQDELNLAKALSGSFKVSEPSDTRKAKPSKIYKESDFLSEEGYRNYLINDDLSQLVPEKFRGNDKGMRGYPGVVMIDNREEWEKPISGSEYKETTKVKEQHVAEESMEEKHNEYEINTSTKKTVSGNKPVAFNLQSKKQQENNSPFTQQIVRELERLNKMLNDQENQLKDLDNKMEQLNYDDPDYDNEIDKLEKEKNKVYGEYQQTLNKYNVLVAKFS